MKNFWLLMGLICSSLILAGCPPQPPTTSSDDITSMIPDDLKPFISDATYDGTDISITLINNQKIDITKNSFTKELYKGALSTIYPQSPQYEAGNRANIATVLGALGLTQSTSCSS